VVSDSNQLFCWWHYYRRMYLKLKMSHFFFTLLWKQHKSFPFVRGSLQFGVLYSSDEYSSE
jgi:hypothetical protein